MGKGVLGAGTVLAVLAAWEVLARAGAFPPGSIPPASAVLAEFVRQLGVPLFWAAVWNTVSVALLGLLLIAVIAAPLALLIGLVRPVQESTWFLMEFLKPIPPVALIPLGLLLWGPSPGMKLFLIVMGAIWPLLTQLIYGIKEINGVGADMARSYRLGWWLTTSRLVFPSVLPFALTGLRISASIAIVIAVVTEMIGGAAGLGQNIVVAQSAGALAEMYALVIAAGLLGLLINAAFRAVQKPLLFWHPSVRQEGNL
ncbi:binding-protein-dependent transport system inner membrane protein [Arthrobacter crystallopoietes BAB-32]|uniref:Binding-protein-dependent transport system inner membrane protein n=1 Tax=Arthrobacter crystallopoietes BAB-32 TaxID=1246476 RepID=N1UZU6_9MICC|nr:binding-protein-dependent transport system inner membrane protein [Arthrobacter crystallopoietes BAB-32]